MSLRWTSALLLLLATTSMAADKAMLDVSSAKEREQYWMIAPEDMPPTMPPLIRQTYPLMQQYGRIVMDYELTINENGVPMDFKLKSITPAGVDPKPFIATLMFYRYQPTPQNSGRRPVRVHDAMPFYIPNIQPGSLPEAARTKAH